jgi:hypothetical protein
MDRFAFPWAEGRERGKQFAELAQVTRLTVSHVMQRKCRGRPRDCPAYALPIHGEAAELRARGQHEHAHGAPAQREPLVRHVDAIFAAPRSQRAHHKGA